MKTFIVAQIAVEHDESLTQQDVSLALGDWSPKAAIADDARFTVLGDLIVITPASDEPFTNYLALVYGDA